MIDLDKMTEEETIAILEDMVKLGHAKKTGDKYELTDEGMAAYMAHMEKLEKESWTRQH